MTIVDNYRVNKNIYSGFNVMVVMVRSWIVELKLYNPTTDFIVYRLSAGSRRLVNALVDAL